MTDDQRREFLKHVVIAEGGGTMHPSSVAHALQLMRDCESDTDEELMLARRSVDELPPNGEHWSDMAARRVLHAIILREQLARGLTVGRLPAVVVMDGRARAEALA